MYAVVAIAKTRWATVIVGVDQNANSQAEIPRMSPVPVKDRRSEFQLRVWSSDQIQEHLPQSEQIEVIDQERGAQNQQPANRVESVDDHLKHWLLYSPNHSADRLPLPEQ